MPTKGGNYLISGNYQAGIIGIDFTNPAAPSVIALRRPEAAAEGHHPNGSTFDPDGGDWSTYWYNGKIYESDIYRGMMVWDLDNTYTNRANTVAIVEPADADRPDRGRQREADDHHRRAARRRPVPPELGSARELHVR